MNRSSQHPAALAALALLACWGAACSPGASDPPSDVAPTAGTPDAPSSPRTGPSFAELMGVGETQPREQRPAPGADYPTLAFRLLSGGLPTTGTWREEPLLHDLDGNGRAELIASNREEDGLNVWRYTEDGDFELRIDGFRRDLMYGGSAAADFDGDGIDDLLFASHKTGLVLYLNDGELNWTEGPAIESPMLMLDVATGDLNGDGFPDAIGIGQFNSGLAVYLGDGQGGLRLLPESKALDWVGFGMTVHMADIDGDGLDDVLVAAQRGTLVLLTRVAEDGTLSFESRSNGLPVTAEGNTTRSVVAADITGDGQLEVITCRIGLPTEDANHFGVYRWDAQGSTWVQIDEGVPRTDSYTEALAADFDQDGHLDLLLASSYGLVTIYRGDGTGAFELAGKLPELVGSRHRAALGDITGNGWVDILLLHGATRSDRRGGGLPVYANGPHVWGSAE